MDNHGRAFAVGIVLNLAFVAVEAGYGVVAHSMALIADAGHNLGDVLALGLAWFAFRLARKPPSAQYTYGLRGSTILVALANAVLLLVISGGILWQAVMRFFVPEPVAGDTVVWIALLGIAINGGTALMFMGHGRHDANIRGAFLHMAADAGVSAGVVVAGFAITRTGWLWIDPAVSVLIVGVIIRGTWGLLREALGLALQAVPPGIDADAIRDYLVSLPEVAAIHDLHVWGMSTTETALTVHLVMPAGHPGDAWLAAISGELHDRYGVGHATLQIETGHADHPCRLAPEHVV